MISGTLEQILVYAVQARKKEGDIPEGEGEFPDWCILGDLIQTPRREPGEFGQPRKRVVLMTAVQSITD